MSVIRGRCHNASVKALVCCANTMHLLSYLLACLLVVAYAYTRETKMRGSTWLDIVEFQFAIEDIVWNVVGSAQPSAGLVVGEDGLEGRLPV